jgi:diphthine-ammonia ligase
LDKYAISHKVFRRKKHLMKVIASWSGGKDGCFACYKAMQQGFEVANLFTMMMSESKSNFHMIPTDMLTTQADAIGIPLFKKVTSPKDYEKDFKNILTQSKAQGINGLVTGDIYEVAGHEEGWLERVCKKAELKPIKPLWMGDTKEIFLDFLDCGFKATVVRTNLERLGIEWLGRQLDKTFYKDILSLGNVDPCGEGGEYHTIVTNGPIFKKEIEILETEKFKLDNRFGYLQIKRFQTKTKSV